MEATLQKIKYCSAIPKMTTKSTRRSGKQKPIVWISKSKPLNTTAIWFFVKKLFQKIGPG
ncbi:MAG: hypothetical protein EP344_00660 [Bacteroidetes bacterium]|nr:MAG: hypothetical protein EP344_00660 [Bacteroidota bacterium]